jgi:hypothetical protein
MSWANSSITSLATGQTCIEARRVAVQPLFPDCSDRRCENAWQVGTTEHSHSCQEAARLRAENRIVLHDWPISALSVRPWQGRQWNLVSDRAMRTDGAWPDFQAQAACDDPLGSWNQISLFLVHLSVNC